MHRSSYQITEVARELDVAVATIRKWEAMGILPFKPRRNLVGRRVFSPDELAQLREFICHRHKVGAGQTRPVGLRDVPVSSTKGAAR